MASCVVSEAMTVAELEKEDVSESACLWLDSFEAVPPFSESDAPKERGPSFHLRTGLLYDDGPFRDLQANVVGKLLW